MKNFATRKVHISKLQSRTNFDIIFNMNSKKEKVIFHTLNIFLPYIKEFIRSGIKNEYITKDEIENLLLKLKVSLQNLKKPKAKEDIKEFLLLFHKIEYENYIEDLLLRRATKILKNDVIKRIERERLAEYFSDDLLKTLRKIKEDDFAKIQKLIITSLSNLDKNKILIDNLVELIALLSFYYFQVFEDDDLHQILILLKDIINSIENKEAFDVPLQKLSNLWVDILNIRKYMRKAFSGILFGDLILYSIGKGLGIKEKLSIVDFTIFTGVKIAEDEIFKKIKKQDIKKIKNGLNKILKDFF